MAIKVGYGDPAEDTGFEPFEPGDYPFIIFNIEELTSKNGTYQMLKFEYNHADSNRKAWDNVIVGRAQGVPSTEGSDMAIGIGRGKLKKLCVDLSICTPEQAVAMFDGTGFEFDEEALYGKSVILKLGAPDEGYNNNKVVSVRPATAEATAAAAGGRSRRAAGF